MNINSIERSISLLDEVIVNPKEGLPEEVFLFTSRISPMVNVDMLILNSCNEVLFTWREMIITIQRVGIFLVVLFDTKSL
jgi:colanic acid biosynthesis protein WcaH